MPESGDTITGDRAANGLVARVTGLCRHFRTPDGVLEILRGIDLEVRPGRMIAIVGASGVGKSTFLHILGGLDEPTAGEVFWGNHRPYALDEEKRARLRNGGVGFVFQFHHLLPEFTAGENVALPLIISGMDHAEALDRASAVLADVGLRERVRHLPGELSGGEQQRTAVARALVTGAPLVVADEPSGNLDRRNAEQLHELLSSMSRGRTKAMVVATHNPDLAGRADDVYLLRDGRLHLQTPSERGRATGPAGGDLP